MDEIEGVRLDDGGNYKRVDLEVLWCNQKVHVVTYAGTDAGRSRFLNLDPAQRYVSDEYLAHLSKGADRLQLPREYWNAVNEKAPRRPAPDTEQSDFSECD
jgi:hypothetical protein